MDGDAKQAIVCFGLSVFGLFRVDDADSANFNQTPDMGRCVHEHHDVERIAVLTLCAGNESEVERKHHSFREKPAKDEKVSLWIVCEFISASFRRLNDDPAGAFRG